MNIYMRRTKFIPANPHTLQFDIDNNRDLKHFLKCLPWFSCMTHEMKMELRAVNFERSRSGNWHVCIKLSKPLRTIERIALQAILGSDRARELCNWERYRFRSVHPILFIKKGKP